MCIRDRFATDDPRGFLSTYPDKTIIDEVQRVPSLFSYIQTHTDKKNKEGMYMLAGSHNFLLMESVIQSLAGRTAVLTIISPHVFLSLDIKKSACSTFPEKDKTGTFTGSIPLVMSLYVCLLYTSRCV